MSKESDKVLAEENETAKNLSEELNKYEIVEYDKRGLRADKLADKIPEVEASTLKDSLDKLIPYDFRVLVQHETFNGDEKSKDVRACPSITLIYEDGSELTVLTEFAKIVAKGKGFAVITVSGRVALGDYLTYLSPYVGKKPVKVKSNSFIIGTLDYSEETILI